MHRRRLIVTALVVATLGASACDDPELWAWWSAQRDAAEARGLPCADHAALINLVGLPEHFHVVAERESECDPGAVNPRSGATGLFQVMPGWAGSCGTTRHGLLDGFTNALCAAYIFARQGPDAWSQTW